MIGFNIGAEAGVRAGENEGERILGLRLGRSRKKQAGEVSPLSHRELQVLMHCTENLVPSESRERIAESKTN